MVDYIDPAVPAPVDSAASHVDSVTPAPEVRVTAPVVPASVSSAANDSLGVIVSSPTARKYLYAGYAGLSLIVTNVAVAFSAANLSSPAWLTIALAVVGNLATPFGALAIANASTKK